MYETNGSYDDNIGRYEEISDFGLSINSNLSVWQELNIHEEDWKNQLMVAAENGVQILSRLDNHKMWDPGEDFIFKVVPHGCDYGLPKSENYTTLDLLCSFELLVIVCSSVSLEVSPLFTPITPRTQ